MTENTQSLPKPQPGQLFRNRKGYGTRDRIVEVLQVEKDSEGVERVFCRDEHTGRLTKPAWTTFSMKFVPIRHEQKAKDEWSSPKVNSIEELRAALEIMEGTIDLVRAQFNLNGKKEG